ncbi:uncharacterized protein LOC106083805 isoform X1 [Stomoxys calcitrans]|uniref:uncharacterized protein LOC106083805 isoform X1 n=1 Tax=Stomoxys calcitrans TaxID=35570 RepID=UPI0027E309F9|nr:uncharacterized protein LOC106083805 isoform X1 [Stomoxys calcitrans]XP_013102509.2 uncharacterized protein LOC106083805 isoform X1 [Stomoxys calcitrans]XP_059217965.1 uncharacterized protein LOC106083805 isoform X1 [Stomoxys calcitrans]
MVNVPPLLCSTPPPIDDIDEDDYVDVLPPTMGGIEDEEFCDFSVEDAKSDESLPSPRPSPDLPQIGLVSDEIYINHLEILPPTGAKIKKEDKDTPIVETYNYSINHQAKESARAKIEKDSFDTTAETHKDVSCSDNKTDGDGVLGETDARAKHISGVLLNLDANNESSYLANKISIEDVEDDLSENELYSPKIPKNFTEIYATNSNDYFKIYDIRSEKENHENLSTIVGNQHVTDLSRKSSLQDINTLPPSNEAVTYNTDDDFGDFADYQDFNTSVQSSVPKTIEAANDPRDGICSGELASNTDEIEVFTQTSKDVIKSDKVGVLESAMDTPSVDETTGSNDDEDFDEFASHEMTLGSVPNVSIPKNLNFESESQMSNSPNTDLICEESENDFADFQEIQIPATEELTNEHFNNRTCELPNPEDLTKVDVVDAFSDYDDDDFGDFNTAQPTNETVSTITTSQSSSTIAHAPLPLSVSKNLNERISNIVQMMFTSVHEPNPLSKEIDAKFKTQKIQDIPFTPIDAAKALEYQWLSSETRHSFIKSLGIDSRNILYGENWNPALPRFAANLSFNPLKPMKPIVSNSGSDCFSPPLEPVPVPSSDCNKPNVNNLAINKKDDVELDWHISTGEQITDASNDKNATITAEIPITSKTEVVSPIPYTADEPPDPLTMFENAVDNDDNKLSTTPPISEMQSVDTFSLPSSTGLDVECNFRTLEINQANGKAKDSLEIVVASTTFSGSFKETHIYTPPKTVENSISTPSTSTASPAKSTNIDFDYERAAMGVIIDETVVKKEYRDIEYNSPFTIDSLTRSPQKIEAENAPISTIQQPKKNIDNEVVDDEESNDEFSDFQSVPTTISTKPLPTPTDLSPPANVSTSESSKVSISTYGMILSPAILIPQAISMESNRPKIEWGEAAASINPEELARIEELFPEPSKSTKSNTNNSSQKSTPTHQAAPTISAAVANKELESGNDDDDWSDFVSVPVVTSLANNNRPISVNNNAAAKSGANSPFKQKSPINSSKVPNCNSNNDDEWSDFVSSAPPKESQQAAAPTQRVPQFNSGAWQNANFYNNPLSLYHKGHLNMHPSAASQQQSSKNFLNNNNNNFHQYNHQFPAATNQQQIHVMQNFSTAPVPTPERLAAAAKTQFQVGSAKVAPSIALIPDLGFVAPAIPTHTSFINSLPKPSINTKK